MHILTVPNIDDISLTPHSDQAFHIPPNDKDEHVYWERVDRNIGWITEGDQAIIKASTVGIAGCGGMGGLLAVTLARLGVGTLHLADGDTFDRSNINRQVAATEYTIGHNKAIETARIIRAIAPDVSIMVYPSGITEASAASFTRKCDMVCDEIEFWAVGSRILLHQAARASNVPVLVAASVGFGTRALLFRPTSVPIESLFGMTYYEACVYEEQHLQKLALPSEVARVQEAVLKTLIPELPHYAPAGGGADRLSRDFCAPIIATNPPCATGFAANHVVFTILRSNGGTIFSSEIPEPPGYLYLDTATMDARAVSTPPSKDV